MTRAWVLLLVDPAEPLTCQLRFGGSLQVTHLRHGAWLLEQGQRGSRFTGRSSFEGIAWTDEHSVCIIEWQDDNAAITFHGKHLSEFHMVSAAAALRERADAPSLQNAVLAVLQGFEQAKAEALSAGEALRAVPGNGGPPAGKVILLGR